MRFALALLAALVPSAAVASMWTDPDWGTMIAKSDLIVRAEVTEGGTFEATVKIVATFRGAAPAESIVVGGFNNGNWPADAVEKESFVAGEAYFLFLRAVSLKEVELLAVRDPERKPLVEKAKAGLLYAVWTPTAGDVPIGTEGVRYRLGGTGYSQHQGARSVEELERFLKAAVAAADGKPDAAYLKEMKAGLASAKAVDPDYPHRLLAYEYAGGSELLPSFDAVTRSGEEDAMRSVARIAGRAGGNEARGLLVTLLDQSDGVVQGEAVRQLGAGVFPAGEVAPLLLARLTKASPVGKGPRSIMDPVRNESAGGQVEIVRALGKLRHAPAEKPLRALLPSAGAELATAILEALDALGSKGAEIELAKRLAGDDLSYDDPTLETIAKRKLVSLRPAVEAFLLRAKSPYDRQDAVQTLGALGDPAALPAIEKTLARLTAHVPVTDHDDASEVRTCLEALAELKTPASGKAAASVAAWWFGIAAGDDAASVDKRLDEANALVARAKAALPGATVVDARARVFAGGASIVEVTVEGTGKPEPLHAALATALALPPESVGVRVQRRPGMLVVTHTDRRLEEHSAAVVLGGLCIHAESVPVATPPGWPALLEKAAGTTCDEGKNRY